MGDEAAWTDVTAHITRTYGPAIGLAVGMSDEELTGFVRSIFEPALTRPFGEVSLAGLMQTIQLQVAKAQGIEAHSRSLGAILHRLQVPSGACAGWPTSPAASCPSSTGVPSSSPSS